ncbi:MAG TPA: hypothetical protein VH643_22525, partial [Gemmataceae bacterium]
MIRKVLASFTEKRIWLIPCFLILVSGCGRHEQKEDKTPSPPIQDEQKEEKTPSPPIQDEQIAGMSSRLLREKNSIKMGVGPVNAL